MENLIEKINAKGAEIRNAEVKRVMSEKEIFASRLEAFKALSPRINKMWDVANALRHNGFKLGDKIDRNGLGNFESDGICHRLGFYYKGNPYWGPIPIDGFGIQGGGCCGSSVYIDRYANIFWRGGILNANTINNLDYRVPTPAYDCGHINCKLVEILEGFDEFERKFYEYAESVIK